MVTGTVLVDLGATKVEHQKNRVCYALEAAPNGAKVIIVVGALVPALSPGALRFVLQHEHRVEIEIQGEAEAVRRWVGALRSGLVDGELL